MILRKYNQVTLALRLLSPFDQVIVDEHGIGVFYVGLTLRFY